MIEHYTDGDLVNEETPVGYLTAADEALAVWGPDGKDFNAFIACTNSNSEQFQRSSLIESLNPQPGRGCARKVATVVGGLQGNDRRSAQHFLPM